MLFKKIHFDRIFKLKSAAISSEPNRETGGDNSQDSIRDDLLKNSNPSEKNTENEVIQIGHVIQVDEFGLPLEGVVVQPVGMAFETVAGGQLIIHTDGSYEYQAPAQWYSDENQAEEMAESFKYTVHDEHGRLLEESVLTICMTEDGPMAYNDYEGLAIDLDEDDAEVNDAQFLQQDPLETHTEKKSGQKLIRSVIYEGKIYSLSADNTYVTVDGTSYNHFNGRTLFFDTAVGGQFQIDLLGETVGEYLYTAPEDFHRHITIESENRQDYSAENQAEEITHKFTFTLAPGIDASSASVTLVPKGPEVEEACGYWYIYRDGELLAQDQFVEKIHDGMAQLEITPPHAQQVFDQLIVLSSEGAEEEGQNQACHFQVKSASFDLDGHIREQVGYVLENEDGSQLSSVFTFKLEENKDTSIVAMTDNPVFNEDQMVVIRVTHESMASEEVMGVTIVSPPIHGLARVNSDHTITYIPHLNYLGGDGFAYQTLDAQSNIQISQIHLAINPANSVAVAVDNQYMAFMNQDLMIFPQHLLEQGEQDDCRVLKIHSYTQPANGLLMAQEDGSLLYRPHKNFVGDDHFSYSVLNTLTNDVLETKQVAIEVQEQL